MSKPQVPSRKWFATQTTALTALLVGWISAGVWDKTLSIALVGLVSQAVVGYLVPQAENSATAVPRPAPGLRRPLPGRLS